MQLSDLHGYIEPHAGIVRRGEVLEVQTLGGLARIASLYRAIRDETGGAVIALDNGDTSHGTYVAVNSKGEALAPMMNALGVAAMTAHWEFAYGPQDFRILATKLDYPVLAINVFEEATNELMFAPYRVVQRAGAKVGIIGIACPIVDKVMSASFSEGLRFTLGRDELPGWIDHLRRVEEVDLVVVLSHLGFPQDVKLAHEVSGIDILASGHTHNRLHDPIIANGTVESGTVISHRHRLIPVDDRIASCPTMQSLVDTAMEPHRASLGPYVGVHETDPPQQPKIAGEMIGRMLCGVEISQRHCCQPCRPG